MVTRSKAEAESNELPVWEKLFRMLLNEEANERRASVSLDADNCHSGRTAEPIFSKKPPSHWKP
jgi:hypothetical protein